MYLNPERWSKVYFSFGTKYDVVDNNMAEYFNAWILGSRHKTIITMLEEIRIKMMKRVGQMRDFCKTWISEISPMAMKVLNDNTTRSMKCNIEWNSDTGYEVLDIGYRHIVDLARQYCSCRAWMLKGILCPHAVVALHHKKLEPINYISHWYNRETYMNTYSFFIQPVLNMKMWPQSQNIFVMPPPVKKLSGSPGKNRKKEEGETKKKTGKLSKGGLSFHVALAIARVTTKEDVQRLHLLLALMQILDQVHLLVQTQVQVQVQSQVQHLLLEKGEVQL